MTGRKIISLADRRKRLDSRRVTAELDFLAQRYQTRIDALSGLQQPLTPEELRQEIAALEAHIADGGKALPAEDLFIEEDPSDRRD